jgi:hypothetical protein
MPLASHSLAGEELTVGIASAIGCTVIVLTYVLFPKLRKLRYVELIFYVALNDLMASIGMALGPSENGTAACWYQGLSSTGSYLSSVFWTSVITYQVYEVVVKEGKVLKDMATIHKVCWGLPLFLTFIPLSTSTYNNPDDEATWCFVADRRGSPPWSQLFWFVVSFYMWLWMAMLWSAFMLVSIGLKLRKLRVVPEVILSTIGKLALYPVIITVCWSLNTLANIYTFSTGHTYDDLSTPWLIVTNLGIVMATLQGLLNALVFLSVNKIVREHWACLLLDIWHFVCCCAVGNATADGETDTGKASGQGNSLSGDRSGVILNGAEDGARGIRSASEASASAGGRNSTSAFASTRGLRMLQAVEDQADYVGEQEGLLSAAANGVSSGGAAADDRMVDASTESSASPLSSVLQGVSRTVSGNSWLLISINLPVSSFSRLLYLFLGWWESSRLSNVSARSSMNFRPSGALTQPPLSAALQQQQSALQPQTVSSAGGTVVEMQRPSHSRTGDVSNPLVASDQR